MNPGEVYRRTWRGKTLHRIVANALYELPDAVMTQRCDAEGNRLDGLVQWTPKRTLARYWEQIQ